MRGRGGEGGMEEKMEGMKLEKWQSTTKGGMVQLSGEKNLSSLSLSLSLSLQAYQTVPWGLLDLKLWAKISHFMWLACLQCKIQYFFLLKMSIEEEESKVETMKEQTVSFWFRVLIGFHVK